MIKDNLFYYAPKSDVVPSSFKEFLPELDHLDKFLYYINQYATLFAGIGQPDVNLAYIKSLYLTILPLYHSLSIVNEKVFSLLILAADKMHQYVPSTERKSVLIPALKRTCMALSVAVDRCNDPETIEMCENHLKKYLRILNTLGVKLNAEDIKIVVASFYREELAQLEDPVLKGLFKQQAINLLHPPSEPIPPPNLS